MAMNASLTAVPCFSHRLEPNTEAEDLTIDVKMHVAQHGASPSSSSFSLSFSTFEFIHDDESPAKQELYYFLIESGVEDDDAQFMLIDLVLLACDVVDPLDEEFTGVLTLTLSVLLRELNRPGSSQVPGSDQRTGGEDGATKRQKTEGGSSVPCA